MQIILLEKVINLGGLGDVVRVKDGYARNYLIPHGKAKRATPDNLAAFEARLMAAARPGMRVKVTGFLAGKSRESKQLVLHATNIEFVEGV